MDCRVILSEDRESRGLREFVGRFGLSRLVFVIVLYVARLGIAMGTAIDDSECARQLTWYFCSCHIFAEPQKVARCEMSSMRRLKSEVGCRKVDVRLLAWKDSAAAASTARDDALMGFPSHIDG
jgi:hypothetical protein